MVEVPGWNKSSGSPRPMTRGGPRETFRWRMGMSEHTEACWAMPECSVCHMRKPPRGRSVGAVAANGYCSFECDGYWEGEQPGHFWPGEEADD